MRLLGPRSPLLPISLRRERCTRQVHRQVSESQIPSPTPFVPDVKTFLTLIGRDLSQHAAKIPTWDKLFTYSSEELRHQGLEPARARRYLLWWRERFRKGVYGIGGDLRHVKDQIAEIRVAKIPLSKTKDDKTPGTSELEKVRKVVLSVPAGQAPDPASLPQDVRSIQGMKVVGAQTIAGPNVEILKGTRGSAGRLKVEEGLWEVKRGHKVDGGERRQKAVRRKREREQSQTTRK